MSKALKLKAILFFLFTKLALSAPLPVIRDAETESLLRDYAQPLLEVAGLSSDVKPVIINNKAINAFVDDGKRIFMNSGLFMNAQTPNEVIGVLAHEIGHIAGGHLIRYHEAISEGEDVSSVGILMLAGALTAGALSESTSHVTNIGLNILGAGWNVAYRSAMAYSRLEERAADRAAITYLNKTGQSGRGILEFFKHLSREKLEYQDLDPYLITHPTPKDRISLLDTVVRESPYFEQRDPKNLQYRHNLVRAKLIGKIHSPSNLRSWYKDSDNSPPAHYARALSHMEQGNLIRSLDIVDSLIDHDPKSPWFLELRGKILLKLGHIDESLASFKKALSLVLDEPLLELGYAYALVASEDKGNLEEAVSYLRRGLEKDPSLLGYRKLAIAEASLGRVAEADLATAQFHVMSGNLGLAKNHARKAQSELEEGSGSWVLADDILSYKQKRDLN